ncbi:unnamed protein product [Amaranthus hypochondriacus]
MDDGEIEPSDPAFLQNPSTCSNNNNNNSLPGGSVSIDSVSIIDEILKHNKRTCTHTHTCNPPGPDAIHTHTCYHTHTQVFSSEEDTKNRCEPPSLKPRRASGNREAVRKYREKKKAHTAHLEQEVKNLRFMNQQLYRKLQGQAALEAELLRLRALLIGLRGKIDVELGNFGFNTTDIGTSFKEGDYGILSNDNKGIRLQCQTQAPCFLPQENQNQNQSMSISNVQGGDKAVFPWQESCEPVILSCQVNDNGVSGASEPV